MCHGTRVLIGRLETAQGYLVPENQHDTIRAKHGVALNYIEREWRLGPGTTTSLLPRPLVVFDGRGSNGESSDHGVSLDA